MTFLFACSLGGGGGVPYDGFKGDCFWRFPKRVHFHFLVFISFSVGGCLGHFQSVVSGTLSDHFRPLVGLCAGTC